MKTTKANRRRFWWERSTYLRVLDHVTDFGRTAGFVVSIRRAGSHRRLGAIAYVKTRIRTVRAAEAMARTIIRRPSILDDWIDLAGVVDLRAVHRHRPVTAS